MIISYRGPDLPGSFNLEAYPCRCAEVRSGLLRTSTAPLSEPLASIGLHCPDVDAPVNDAISFYTVPTKGLIRMAHDNDLISCRAASVSYPDIRYVMALEHD